MLDHRNLRAFQLADELALLVYRETAGFPKEEMFGLTSQVRVLRFLWHRTLLKAVVEAVTLTF